MTRSVCGEGRATMGLLLVNRLRDSEDARARAQPQRISGGAIASGKSSKPARCSRSIVGDVVGWAAGGLATGTGGDVLVSWLDPLRPLRAAALFELAPFGRRNRSNGVPVVVSLLPCWPFFPLPFFP